VLGAKSYVSKLSAKPEASRIVRRSALRSGARASPNLAACEKTFYATANTRMFGRDIEQHGGDENHRRDGGCDQEGARATS
jgi:hypothetical protein